jgi:hypothetical protein
MLFQVCDRKTFIRVGAISLQHPIHSPGYISLELCHAETITSVSKQEVHFQAAEHMITWPVVRQWLGKHISATTDTHPKLKDTVANSAEAICQGQMRSIRQS